MRPSLIFFLYSSLFSVCIYYYILSENCQKLSFSLFIFCKGEDLSVLRDLE